MNACEEWTITSDNASVFFLAREIGTFKRKHQSETQYDGKTDHSQYVLQKCISQMPHSFYPRYFIVPRIEMNVCTTFSVICREVQCQALPYWHTRVLAIHLCVDHANAACTLPRLDWIVSRWCCVCISSSAWALISIRSLIRNLDLIDSRTRGYFPHFRKIL